MPFEIQSNVCGLIIDGIDVFTIVVFEWKESSIVWMHGVHWEWVRLKQAIKGILWWRKKNFNNFNSKNSSNNPFFFSFSFHIHFDWWNQKSFNCLVHNRFLPAIDTQLFTQANPFQCDKINDLQKCYHAAFIFRFRLIHFRT